MSAWIVMCVIVASLVGCDRDRTPVAGTVTSFEIRLVMESDDTVELMETLDRGLSEMVDSASVLARADENAPENLRPVGPLKSIVHSVRTDIGWMFFVRSEDLDSLKRMLFSDGGDAYPELLPGVRALIPSDVDLYVSHIPVGENNYGPYYSIFACLKTPSINLAHVRAATSELQRLPDHPDEEYPAVMLDLNETGRDLLKSITSENVGRRLAFIINGTVYTAPRVLDPITVGRCMVTGMENLGEAESLVVAIKHHIAEQ